MNKNYSIKDILVAVDNLLDSSEKKTLEINDKNEKPFVLKKEIKVLQKRLDKVPENTEKIILQAEKYLKK